MDYLVEWMPIIMMISGGLTFTMISIFFSPKNALRASFGESLEGPLADVVVRNWAALIAIVGLMLIYGAFMEESRPLVLAVAILSKLIYAGLILRHREFFKGKRAMLFVKLDLLMVVLFAIYLFVDQVLIMC